MLEKRTVFVYPYAKDASEQMTGIFEPPDLALLEDALGLRCPVGHQWRGLDDISIEACLTGAWEAESQQTDSGETAYVLTLEPMVTGQAVPPDGLLVVFIVFSAGLAISCPEPGHLTTPAGPMELCFYPPHSLEEGGFSAAFTHITFTLHSEGGAKVTGMVEATRAFTDDPITLEDDAFREAIAILANLRPE